MKVGKTAAGQRLDLFLKARLGISRKQAKRLIDAGRARINQRKVVIASWELKPQDEVTIADDSRIEADPAHYYVKVVHEDVDLIVVDKPAGIGCEASRLSLQPTLPEILNAYLRKGAPDKIYPYLGLIHRLDTDTSGLMVYTKRKEANRLSRQFKNHTIVRRYHALVVGAVEKEQGVISSYLVKEDQPGGKKVKIVSTGEGKKAQSHYRILERYQNVSLLELEVSTGRTHQIRVHLASIRHPLIGDRLYGATDPDGISLKRHALHAAFLGFEHPITRKNVEFRSDLPRDMRRLVNRLRSRV